MRRVPEGSKEIEERRERRVLDEHSVSRPQMRTQHALDGIERTARHRHVAGGDAVRFKLRRRKRNQGTQLERIAVETMRGIQRLEVRGQQRQKIGIWITRGEIDRALQRDCCRRDRSRRVRHRADVGSASSAPDDQPPRLKEPIGGGNGHGADAKRAGEAAYRGQAAATGQAGVEVPLHRKCYFCRGFALYQITRHYVL